MDNKPKLQVIPGSRAGREVEALRAIPTDFQKFSDISRSPAPAANGPLKLAAAPTLNKLSEETNLNRPPIGGQN